MEELKWQFQVTCLDSIPLLKLPKLDPLVC